MTQDPQYTVFIRLPFPRKDFEDPPPVQWNGSKDQQLWKVISSALNSRELNWDELSRILDVPLPFLLQQAAWLYERHFEGMKAQMRRLSVAAPVSAPSTPFLDGDGKRKASAGASSRIPPNINTQKSPVAASKDGASDPGTPKTPMPVISRTPSTNTVTQSRVFTSSSSLSKRPVSSRGKNAVSSTDRRQSVDAEDLSTFQDAPTEASDSEADETTPPRPRTFSAYRSAKESQSEVLSSDADAEGDDEGDSSGGFLPFAGQQKTTNVDPAATLKHPIRRQSGAARQQPNPAPKEKPPPPSSSVSSASSAHQPPSDSYAEPTNSHSAALSPQQRAQLARLSPRTRKSGSDESPSMGSSFSDLDDTSITQSALGEALLSNMQHGSIGIGSRMSSLRDTLGKRQ